jgi:hypothetical protein
MLLDSLLERAVAMASPPVDESCGRVTRGATGFQVVFGIEIFTLGGEGAYSAMSRAGLELLNQGNHGFRFRKYFSDFNCWNASGAESRS